MRYLYNWTETAARGIARRGWLKGRGAGFPDRWGGLWVPSARNSAPLASTPPDPGTNTA